MQLLYSEGTRLRFQDILTSYNDPTLSWQTEFPVILKHFGPDGMVEMARLICSIQKLEPDFINMHKALADLEKELGEIYRKGDDT
jgi:hypothetical protein